MIPGAGARGEELERRLSALPEIEGAGCLALYVPILPEPSSGSLASRFASRRLCYPVVSGSELVFRESDGRALVPGSYPGLQEPDATCPEVALEEIDIFVVPGLGFDRRGVRLGRGKGYYDRVLSRAAPGALFIGVCFAECFVEALPAAPADVPMHLIATDRALHRVIR